MAFARKWYGQTWHEPSNEEQMLRSWSHHAALPLRLVLGVVFVVHGAQKFFGVFGGDGLPRTGEIAEAFGFEPGMLWAALLGGFQLLGGLALLLGVLTRWAALALALERFSVLILVNVPAGFTASRGGFEFSLTVLAALLGLACIIGAQALAFDARVPRLSELSPPRETMPRETMKKAA
jgi:putative oxidoreductase